MTKKEFVTKARKIHGNKYDYSKVEYQRSTVWVSIICPIHGEFKQTPAHHLNGEGCPQCGLDQKRKKCAKGTEQFIKESKARFGDKFNYSKVQYINNKTNVTLICPIHGEFQITPQSHLKSMTGCNKCGQKIRNQALSIDKEQFIKKALSVHGSKYNYSKVKYINNKTEVIVTCPIHSDFLVRPDNHIHSQSGCPKCTNPISEWERQVYDFVKRIDCNAEQSNRVLLNGLEIDILCHVIPLAIECDGLLWHDSFHKKSFYHLFKTIRCKENDIQLIHIFEDEWEYKYDICKSLIVKALSACSNKITQCCAKLISHEEAKSFLDNNSLIGYQEATLHIGLFSNGKLVAVGSFEDKDEYFEITQYYEKIDVVVENGFKTMFEYFVDRCHPTEVVIRIDKRWKNNLLLEKVDFEHVADELPSFKYVKEKKRLTVQEVVMDEKLLTKMQENKLPKIYDCGQELWKWQDG